MKPNHRPRAFRANPLSLGRLAPAVLLVPALLLASCGSKPVVHVSSQPETARIYVNGQLMGNTPTDVALPFDEGDRVYVQVVHPAGKQVGTQVFTHDNVPRSGEVTFDLR
jgi:hypothetical protein